MKTSKALIFDIKRFAVHDGEGIRTTLFFKGCPLRCKWCQNPEGLLSKRQPIFLPKKCVFCRFCDRNKKEGQMTFTTQPIFNLEYPDFDNLVDICPASAIQYDSKYYSVDELIEVIKEDKVFYRENGGVTFSGGEPFMQGEFISELAKRCKEENISSTIETSLYTSKELIDKVIPYLDRIYIDLKIFDEDKHELYTGVSSKVIKDNISYILTGAYKDKVIIRTPLIPDISATDENIKAISKYIYDLYSDVKYELLNYNPLAPSKYELVGMEYELKDAKRLNEEQMKHFYELVLSTGLKNIVIE